MKTLLNCLCQRSNISIRLGKSAPKDNLPDLGDNFALVMFQCFLFDFPVYSYVILRFTILDVELKVLLDQNACKCFCEIADFSHACGKTYQRISLYESISFAHVNIVVLHFRSLYL